ncbi:MAG: hypothetical protein ACRDSJ_20655 [Rubrobacteraceae bacterium]
MGLKIVCSGFLVRYPLGGHSWHQLQYLVGFRRLGHEVTFFEHYGWPDSCYDPIHNEMTANPSYGIEYLRDMLQPHGLENQWCYLAEDGTAHGMTRERLAGLCRECDVYFNLDNINWIPELEECRRRVLVDVDPVFTQIGGHGLGGPFSRYHALFTYGENVHKPGCEMPTGGARWLPTRQPVVLDLWPEEVGDPSSPFTSVMNWSAYGDREREGRLYGQKDREFEPFFSLPRDTGEKMELAVSAPKTIRRRLLDGGWRLANPLKVTRDLRTYQRYLRGSRAEFCVAKHGYVSTRSGWFSDRSAGYLATGRPVVVQDTGFSDFLPCGEGLLAYRTPNEAMESIRRVGDDYEAHCRAARKIVEEYFHSDKVLGDVLERSCHV